MDAIRRRHRMNLVLRQVLLVGGTIVIAFVVLVPIIWMMSAAVRPIREVLSYPPALIPEEFTLRYFERIFSNPTYRSMARNSTILSLSTLGLTLTLGSLAAYGFSRFKMPGGRAMLLGILALLMLPRVTVVVPFFQLAHAFQIYDTVLGLVVVNTTFLLPLSTWLLKGYMDSIPVELEEAALIDGCNRLQSLWKVLIPLAVPGMVGVGTFIFIGSWNEYLLAVIMTDSPSSWTLPVGLGKFFGEHVRDWNGIMALSTLTSLPLLVIFVLFQRWVVQGMTSGAVK